MSNNKTMWGADPEVCAVYEKNGELLVLPPVYLRQMKNLEFKPNGRHSIFLEQDDFMVHEDGVSFELSVPPSENWETVFDEVQAGYTAIEDTILSRFLEDCQAKIAVLPTVKYEWERWFDMPEDFKVCNIFGCDPDQDAFDIQTEDVVMDVHKHPYRYFGGHIHRSGSDMFAEQPINAVKFLAMTAGVAAVAFSDEAELERMRTFLYGKPGKFRIQEYKDGAVGIEYRTVSNTWTKSKDIARRVFTWFDVGVTELLEKGLGFELLDELEIPTIDAILKADQPLAFQILERIKEKI